MTARKPLPPFGKSYLKNPRNGAHVAIGPTAWDFAKTRRYPVMVLPEVNRPTDLDWPATHGPALIWERGDCNDLRLDETARELLKAGASSVVAIREALLNVFDPRVFYDKEVVSAAA